MTPRIIKIAIKEMILFTTASEIIKDIGINLTEEGQNLNLAKKSWSRRTEFPAEHLEWVACSKTSRALL